jgi:hypothetical protein
VKARTKQLLDQGTAAMLAAIEIYNKPQFSYRAQSFAILALNAWQLLLKAKWLSRQKEPFAEPLRDAGWRSKAQANQEDPCRQSNDAQLGLFG